MIINILVITVTVIVIVSYFSCHYMHCYHNYFIYHYIIIVIITVIVIVIVILLIVVVVIIVMIIVIVCCYSCRSWCDCNFNQKKGHVCLLIDRCSVLSYRSCCGLNVQRVTVCFMLVRLAWVSGLCVERVSEVISQNFTSPCSPSLSLSLSAVVCVCLSPLLHVFQCLFSCV